MDILSIIRSDIGLILVDVAVIALALLFIFQRKFRIAAVVITVLYFAKLVVFVGLRAHDAGNDTATYLLAFDKIEGLANAREIGQAVYGNSGLLYEPLYWPSVALFKIFSSDFTLFLTVSIVVSGALVFGGNLILVNDYAVGAGQTRSESRMKQAKVFAYAALFTYLAFMTFELAYFGGHIRSALGVPLAVLAFVFALRRRPLISGAFFILAICFHNSAIAVAPVIIVIICAQAVQRWLPNMVPKQWKNRKPIHVRIAIVSALVIAFIIGQFDLLGGALKLVGGFYYDRYIAYVNYDGFNISSIYQTSYFWIILVHIIFFIAVGHQKVHIYVYYFMFLVLIFMATPKISERYFEYLLICLPLLTFLTLRSRFSERAAIVYASGLYVALGALSAVSVGLTSTLGLTAFIGG